MKKIKLIFLVAFFLATTGLVLAEEGDVVILEGEDVIASDLGVEEPNILPDSRFYFLKEWSRGIGNFFTFNPIKKAERKLTQANEKLIEAKKIAEKTGNENIAVKAMEKYQIAIEKAGAKIEEIKEGNQDNPRFQELVDKFVGDNLTQSRLLNNLRIRYENVSDEAREKAEMLRERAEERVGDVLEDIDNIDKEKVDERLERILENSGEKINEVNTNQVEALKRVQIKLREKLPEASNADDVLNKVIERKEEQIRQREEIMQNTKPMSGSVKAGLANPASVYCLENGGELERKTNEKGEYAICNLPNGARCEEWSFFNGGCGK